MLEKISHSILKIEKCIGVEVSLLSNEELAISGVVLKLEKNRIRKEKEWHFLSSFKDLADKTGVQWPLALTVNGKGVLQKKMPLQDLPDRPVEKFLPNANPNEFYHTVTRLGEIASVSIIRKELLDKIIADLQGKGFRVLSVALGIADLQYLIPFLTPEKRLSLSTPHFSLLFNDQRQLVDIENVPVAAPDAYDKIEYNIGDQYVYSPALLAFGSATGLLAAGPEGHPPFDHPGIRKEREEYKYSRYYKTSLLATLIGLFSILLINFFVYNHYFSANRDREGVRQISREQEAKMKKLSAGLRSKENFLVRSGWEAEPRLSFFADRIAGLVPTGTLLTGMRINPVNSNNLGDGKTVTFKKDTIQVTGTCDDPTELNQFTNNLKNIRDFKEVGVRNYVYKKEIRSGIFFMEIITK